MADGGDDEALPLRDGGGRQALRYFPVQHIRDECDGVQAGQLKGHSA